MIREGGKERETKKGRWVGESTRKTRREREREREREGGGGRERKKIIILPDDTRNNSIPVTICNDLAFNIDIINTMCGIYRAS